VNDPTLAICHHQLLPLDHQEMTVSVSDLQRKMVKVLLLFVV